ncbi:hypothetical protein HOY82DRAFT_607541 [Tuber indicum]|nr:hypothetical protein HOY82DRAFT_607541 [Tuber indicum]
MNYYPRSLGMEFTGEEDSIGVVAFLNLMESWVATLGPVFNGSVKDCKRLGLLNEILWDELAFTKALVEGFQDGEQGDHTYGDLLLIMSNLKQGERDVFFYSRKVVKVLRKRPYGVPQFDGVLIRYYIDGLKNRRLREMATGSFRRPSDIATEHDDDPDLSDGEESSSTDDSESDLYSEVEQYHCHSKKQRSSERVMNSRKSKEMKERRSGSKNRRYRKGSDEEQAEKVPGKFAELQEMIKDLMKIPQGAANSKQQAVVVQQEEDVRSVRITPYTSLPSVRPKAVHRIYKRRPLARPGKWNEVNPSTTQEVTGLQRCDIFGKDQSRVLGASPKEPRDSKECCDYDMGYTVIAGFMTNTTRRSTPSTWNNQELPTEEL